MGGRKIETDDNNVVRGGMVGDGDGDAIACDRKEEKEVTCSICLEIILAGERATAKLKCGHEFHLDCIGSAFNAKGAMQCPNCRVIERGDWKYNSGPLARTEIREPDLDDLGNLANSRYFAQHLRSENFPFRITQVMPSYEEGGSSPPSYAFQWETHDLQGRWEAPLDLLHLAASSAYDSLHGQIIAIPEDAHTTHIGHYNPWAESAHRRVQHSRNSTSESSVPIGRAISGMSHYSVHHCAICMHDFGGSIRTESHGPDFSFFSDNGPVSGVQGASSSVSSVAQILSALREESNINRHNLQHSFPASSILQERNVQDQ